ncbi:DUF255 domain-containing protein [Sulfurimonas aquatica]|uniref:DUF255 domain-containing protein n=1 Tax=Sulfurimonas aquatica TaxID=2672570 RepID=A0A975B0M3_9BACT|nr:DUF255 domain-containing protein [Sulfurimonas aquatica]QSZ42056.1 DUF255 domain-containing protein [Sulfurimonas aquatica]
MKNFLLIMLFIFILLNDKASSNELRHETSPYLLQHANNPVEWYPWGNKAFAKAKKENRAIFLSIGYSTCHWCHVMEEESFSDKQIAKLFNKYFISIKIDREEMPHIDSFYQREHIRLKNHSGGWPLSIFMTADKEIIDINTYIPATRKSYSEGLDSLLEKVGSSYKKGDFNLLQEVGKKSKTQTKRSLSITTLSNSLKESYDDIYAGFGQGRKFPEAAKLSLMMDIAEITQDSELQTYLYEMLDAMAFRGLYDHIEGGFFRYSVDAAWEIPHFEKMLYNQAELIPLYVRAYKKSKKEVYKEIVEETIGMLESRFLKDNLYYSASDADTNHEEGVYFTFTTEDLKNLKFEYYENFEDRVHINFYENKRPDDFMKIKNELLKVRAKKEYPFIDKKINTAWNAMMIEALCTASFIDKKYAKKAQRTLNALKEFMFKRSELYHQSVLGVTPTQKALLEDYSFFISALIAGYEVDYKKEKLDFAEYLLAQAIYKFYKSGVWYLSDDGLKIEADIKDKYYTSALAKMTQNLAKMASLKSSFKYETILDETLKSLKSDLVKKQSNAPALAQAYLMRELNIVTLKSSKPNLELNAKQIKEIKYPYMLSKVHEYDEYLACSMRECFVVDKRLENVIDAINKRYENIE